MTLGEFSTVNRRDFIRWSGFGLAVTGQGLSAVAMAQPAPVLSASVAPAVRYPTVSSLALWRWRPALASSRPEKPRRTPRTDAGKWLRSDETSWPRKIESSSFVKPRKSIDAPRRAPNRCCAASPPAPWQHGIAPKRQPTQFISPTDVATDVCDGTEISVDLAVGIFRIDS